MHRGGPSSDARGAPPVGRHGRDISSLRELPRRGGSFRGRLLGDSLPDVSERSCSRSADVLRAGGGHGFGGRGVGGSEGEGEVETIG